MRILETAQQIQNEVVFLRRELHKRAELSFMEHKTSAFIAEYLENLGLSVRKHVAGTGIVAYLDAGKTHTLLLRADMDALPVTETQNTIRKQRELCTPAVMMPIWQFCLVRQSACWRIKTI